MNKNFFKIFAVLIWLLVIFSLSSIPGKAYPQAAFDYGVFAHLAEYFVLGFLVVRTLGKYTFKKLVFTIIFCLLFAIFDEIYQSFVPFRDVSVLDWLFDTMGALLGMIGFWFKKKV
jgi:VanZ family protein